MLTKYIVIFIYLDTNKVANANSKSIETKKDYTAESFKSYAREVTLGVTEKYDKQLANYKTELLQLKQSSTSEISKRLLSFFFGISTSLESSL